MVQAGQTSVCYDGDFYPFGGERVVTNTCSQNYKFEGKERDTETQNDDFGARYYTSRLGRWLSADWSAVPAPVPYANLTNPQTLNLYAMVSDNPETFADLDGHVTCGQALPGSLQDCTKTNPSPAATTGGNDPGSNKNGTNTPNSPTQTAQQQNKDEGSAKARATEAAEAGLNLTLAGAKIKIAAAAAGTSESGVGAVAAAYTAISAAGNLAVAGMEAVGAATGKTKEAETAAEVASVVTSASGLITLVVSKGNLNKAAFAAAAEGIVTSNPADLAKGGTVARAAKAVDLMQNIHQVEQKIKSWF